MRGHYSPPLTSGSPGALVLPRLTGLPETHVPQNGLTSDRTQTVQFRPFRRGEPAPKTHLHVRGGSYKGRGEPAPKTHPSRQRWILQRSCTSQITLHWNRLRLLADTLNKGRHIYQRLDDFILEILCESSFFRLTYRASHVKPPPT